MALHQRARARLRLCCCPRAEHGLYSSNLINVSGVGANPRGVAFDYPAGYALVLPTAPARFQFRDFMKCSNPSVLTHLTGIPADAVVDVASLDFNPAERAVSGPCLGFGANCENWLAPNFERGVALLGDQKLNMATARKSLGLSASGHDILQRTHYSSRNFEYHQPLLRSLKKR